MKVLHITPSYKPAFKYGGPTVSVSRLCEELAKAGAEVDVFTTTANGKAELPVQPGEMKVIEGVQVTYFKRLTGDHTHFSPALLHALWKHGEGYDIIHIHSWWNLVSVFTVLICGLRGWRPCLAPRGMLSAYSFQHENSIKKILIHRLLGKYLLSRTVLHATTALEVNDCQKVIPHWQHILLPNIVKLTDEWIPESSASNEAAFKLIFLSRVDPKKGLELLFDALNQVVFPFQLHIYGNQEDAYEEQLQQLVNQTQVGEQIYWHGWIEGESKFVKLADADLFVLTSHNENFANVVLESLSVNTPVLLSNQVGLADYVQQKKLGWVCSLAVDDIIAKLNMAYASLKENRNSSCASAEVVTADFHPSTLAHQYLQEYYAFKSEKTNAYQTQGL